MPKSLKEQNNWKIWLFVSINVIFFYSVLVSGKIQLSGLKEAIASASTLLPAGIAGVIATAINALPSSQMKARIVYLRWKNPLPGHRAFSLYAHRDPRIDVNLLEKRIGKLPADEGEQNRTWYRLYKAIADQEVISSVHRDFLLMRDFTTLSAIMFVVMSSVSAVILIERVMVVFVAAIIAIEFALFRQAAANCGIRMVTNVLAGTAAMPIGPSPNKATKAKR